MNLAHHPLSNILDHLKIRASTQFLQIAGIADLPDIHIHRLLISGSSGGRFARAVPVFDIRTYLVQGCDSHGGHGRMADADHQQKAPGNVAATHLESTAAAVSQLFREHNRVLVAYLTSRLRCEQEAKEVAQEAYVRLLQLQEPDRPSLLRAYLFKTATNLAIDRLRHRTIQHRAQEQPELFEDLNTTRGELDDPARQLLAREQAERLLCYLQELPIKCQQVIDLHRLEELPQHEVAVRVGISERMVRRYVTYAMVYCHLRLDGMAAGQVRQRVSL
jgi:RNA polymerase sigma factor (sigma-70 family)